MPACLDWPMGMAYSSCHQLGVWCRTLYEAKPSTKNPLGGGFGRIQAVPNKALGLGKNNQVVPNKALS